MELLTHLAEAADEEAASIQVSITRTLESVVEYSQSKTKQQVCQYRSQDRRLDDRNKVSMLARTIPRMMFGNQNDEQDDFHDASECSLDQDSADLWHLPGKLLACETQEIGYGHHGDVAGRKDGNGH